MVTESILGVRSIRRWECWDLIKTVEGLPRVWHHHGTNRILWLMWRHVTRDIETTGHVGPGTLQQQMILLKRTFKQTLYKLTSEGSRASGQHKNISSCICTNVPAIMTRGFAITVKGFSTFLPWSMARSLAWPDSRICFASLCSNGCHWKCKLTRASSCHQTRWINKLNNPNFRHNVLEAEGAFSRIGQSNVQIMRI